MTINLILSANITLPYISIHSLFLLLLLLLLLGAALLIDRCVFGLGDVF